MCRTFCRLLSAVHLGEGSCIQQDFMITSKSTDLQFLFILHTETQACFVTFSARSDPPKAWECLCSIHFPLVVPSRCKTKDSKSLLRCSDVIKQPRLIWSGHKEDMICNSNATNLGVQAFSSIMRYEVSPFPFPCHHFSTFSNLSIQCSFYFSLLVWSLSIIPDFAREHHLGEQVRNRNYSPHVLS